MEKYNQNAYPDNEQHERNWHILARGIASTKEQIHEVEAGEIPPNSKKGSLTILGTGIETISISAGDVKLIEQADKVIYCVADPATVCWLNQLRPDALDLYVLYGEDKVRYVTYMQMTEAQLYWVRQGLNVVCLFYGHPGIFVLSTHRAIMIARREGYRATMKAGICALDTLCADLGIDPCNPGLQTYEATEALIRQRKLDTTANIVLWQVGLIGEGGYRRLGFLNNNFSYFVDWLQEVYGKDFEITHYIGSRYPTIEALVEVYKLSDLHHPSAQSKINGLSTFYIPPKDIVETNKQVCLDLGMIRPGQHIVPPKTPLREIGKYTSREMKAFDVFADFKVPYSYKFQKETEACKFLIALRFDPALQELYREDPVLALKDPRFKKLSDQEIFLLSSRDAGAIQIAAKGLHIRHAETENFIKNILTNRRFSTKLSYIISKYQKEEAKKKLLSFISETGYDLQWKELRKSFDWINQQQLYSWTGVYLEEKKELVVTIIGSLISPGRSLLYVNNCRVKSFKYRHGMLQWKSGSTNPFNGFLRPDIEINGRRKVVGKIWGDDKKGLSESNFVAYEADLKRSKNIDVIDTYNACSSLEKIKGEYVVRTTGKYSKTANDFVIGENVSINGSLVKRFNFKNGVLTWFGGNRECFEGEVRFFLEPILGNRELFGKSKAEESDSFSKCYGSSLMVESHKSVNLEMAQWAEIYLTDIVKENICNGGVMLWHKWEKHNFLTRLANKIVLNFTT